MDMEWIAMCRVCLQEDELRSVYDKDDKEITIYEKLVKCSNITVKRDMIFPEHICNKCHHDLEVAYHFRTNCEASDAILQSLIESNMFTDYVMSSVSGEEYEYKPTLSVTIERLQSLPIKMEPSIDKDIDAINEDIGISDQKTSVPVAYIDVKKETNSDSDNSVRDHDLDDDVKVSSTRPMRIEAQSAKLKAPAKEVKTKPSATTIKRNRKSEKGNRLKICDICGKTFRCPSLLESHLRRHRNEKPFTCEICGQSFVIIGALTSHMRTHNGEKPYACRYCEQKYSDCGNRNKHQRTHTGERPYVCKTCGKGFAYSHSLSSHMLMHTGEKRYACMICDMRCAKPHHLRSHMERMHTKNSKK